MRTVQRGVRHDRFEMVEPLDAAGQERRVRAGVVLGRGRTVVRAAVVALAAVPVAEAVVAAGAVVRAGGRILGALGVADAVAAGAEAGVRRARGVPRVGGGRVGRGVGRDPGVRAARGVAVASVRRRHAGAEPGRQQAAQGGDSR